MQGGWVGAQRGRVQAAGGRREAGRRQRGGEGGRRPHPGRPRSRTSPASRPNTAPSATGPAAPTPPARVGHHCEPSIGDPSPIPALDDSETECEGRGGSSPTQRLAGQTELRAPGLWGGRDGCRPPTLLREQCVPSRPGTPGLQTPLLRETLLGQLCGAMAGNPDVGAGGGRLRQKVQRHSGEQ